MSGPDASLIDHIDQIAWQSSPDGGVLWFNRRWYDYVGAIDSTTEAAAATVHPDDRERVLATWAEARDQHNTWRCEYRLRRHDGVYRRFAGRAVPVIYGCCVTYWAGSATDVEDLRLLSEALGLHLQLQLDRIAETLTRGAPVSP